MVPRCFSIRGIFWIINPPPTGKRLPCYEAFVHHRPRWVPFVKSNGTWGCVSTTPSFCDGPLRTHRSLHLPMEGMEGMEGFFGVWSIAAAPAPMHKGPSAPPVPPLPPYPPLRNISDLTSDDLGTHSTGSFWFRASFCITEWCLVVFHPWTLRDNQPASRGKAHPVI